MMRFLKIILMSALIVSGFNTCTILKKDITKPVVLAMPDKSIDVTVNSTAFNTKYSNNLSKEDLADQFLENFEREAEITTNVTLTNDEKGSDFIIKVKSLTINETSKTETVNDEKSPYYGQEIVLNTIECSAEVEIINTKDKTKTLKNCYNSKIRSEELKNNRDLVDLVVGTNRDHTSYRTKLLADDICINLAGDVGQRIWVPITRRIAKAI